MLFIGDNFKCFKYRTQVLNKKKTCYSHSEDKQSYDVHYIIHERSHQRFRVAIAAFKCLFLMNNVLLLQEISCFIFFCYLYSPLFFYY